MVNELKLVLVNIFHRHGERAPLNRYEQPLGRIEACSKANEYHEKLPIPKKSFFKSFFSKSNTPLSFELIYKPLSNIECAPGQLTDHGKRTLFNLGRRLRKDYVDTGFISKVYNKNEVHLTSTDFQRTIESLQSLCKGLFSKSYEPIPINIGKRGVKSLYTSTYCEYYKKSKAKHREYVKEKHQESIKTIKSYVSKKYKIFDPNSSVYEIFDIVMSSIGNKNNFFSGFSPKILALAEKFSLDLFYGHLSNKRNLSIYRGEIIKDLHDRIKDVAMNHYRKTKMFILSAHDVTIYPLLMAFKIDDGKWPNFGSNIVCETFEDKNGKFYVRVKYNGCVKELPECRKNFNGDPTYCDVDEFLKICKQYIPINREALCEI